MKKITTLMDLLAEQIHSLYETESKLKKAVYKLIDDVDSVELGRKLNQYADKTKEKIARFEEIFSIMRESESGNGNETVEAILKSSKKIISRITLKEVRDAAILSKVQRINHLLICEYGTACAFARALDLEKVAELLHESLVEEKQADQELSILAKEEINIKAIKEVNYDEV
ncbi:MAG: DUF892 family protein [Bacteroidetes bacterium]|nr:MAG: DUF892 family protein [Bacteroidota bacterium]